MSKSTEDNSSLGGPKDNASLGGSSLGAGGPSGGGNGRRPEEEEEGNIFAIFKKETKQSHNG